MQHSNPDIDCDAQFLCSTFQFDPNTCEEALMPLFDNETIDCSMLDPAFFQYCYQLSQSTVQVTEKDILPSCKRIGSLTVAERELKIQNFREKRKRRQYHKRKPPAPKKTTVNPVPRVNRRFITQKQADLVDELMNGD